MANPNYSIISEIIPNSEEARAKKICYNLKIGEIPLSKDFCKFLTNFKDNLAKEKTKPENQFIKSARIWYLKNLILTLSNDVIDPTINAEVDAEKFIVEYPFIIDYFVELSDFHPKDQYIIKICDIIQDFLLFDYFLKEVSKSNFHLTSLVIDCFLEDDSVDYRYFYT